VRLVVGLGNPGPRYVGTRHNVGYRIASVLAARLGLDWADSAYRGSLACSEARDLALLMPSTFMNASGESVVAAVDALAVAPATGLLVAFDDLDLPFGRLRLRAAGGCGGHRGMESIAQALGSEGFPRLRFGIGRPAPGADVIGYVLSPFEAEEEAALPVHLERAADAILSALDHGIDAAMERYNRPADEAEAKSSGKNVD
jgi:PTH1 family peptidyl-tRNA hydrolase